MSVISCKAPPVLNPDRLPTSLRQAYQKGREALYGAYEEFRPIKPCPYTSKEKARYWQSGVNKAREEIERDLDTGTDTWCRKLSLSEIVLRRDLVEKMAELSEVSDIVATLGNLAKLQPLANAA